jgi:hypothetical protein
MTFLLVLVHWLTFFLMLVHRMTFFLEYHLNEGIRQFWNDHL